MLNKFYRNILLIILFFSSSVCVLAQSKGESSSYSPYTVFGIGDLLTNGTSYNKSMAGVGVASRTKAFVNYLNPAAITDRDSLSFLMNIDISIVGKQFQQKMYPNSYSNIFNISNISLTLPIYKKSAFVLGLAPYSSISYNYSTNETDPNIIGNLGNITYNSSGLGGLYYFFIGPAATFWDKLSLGLQAHFIFGSINKYSNVIFANSNNSSIYKGYSMNMTGFALKFGLQYEQRIADRYSMIFGLTYKPSAKLSGYLNSYKYLKLGSKADTLLNRNDTLSRLNNYNLGNELSVGYCFKQGSKWSAEFDYTLSDWRNTGIDKVASLSAKSDVTMKTTLSQSFRLGFEYTPNINDLNSYFNRCSYRGGFYYNKDYFTIDGNNINSIGLTFGATFPVFRWYNGLSVCFDIGQRGSLLGHLTRERYIKFTLGVNISDYWFIKPKYQ